MSCIRVLCWVDEENAGQMTELASVDMPEVDISTLEPETALDEFGGTDL